MGVNPSATGRRGATARRPPVSRVAIVVVVAVALVLAGVVAYALTRSPSTTGSRYQPQVRLYYIASEPVVWNYTPSGTNELTGVPLGSKIKDLYVDPGAIHPSTYVNGTYPMETFEKCVYEQYEDPTFSTPVVRPASQAYLGIDGPVLYAAVGDTIRIEFQNHCSFPTSLSAPGITSNGSSPGSIVNGSSSGAPVAPGGTSNYTWAVSAAAGPGPTEPGSVMQLYDDGAAPTNGTDTGLFGAVIVSSDADADPNGTPADVSANIVLLFGALDEGQSPYYDYNVAHYTPDAYALKAGYVRYAINGYNFGNLPMITLTEGEHERWYVGDVGSATTDPFWTGNTLVSAGANVATVELAAGTSTGLDMWANDSGVWLVESADPGDLTGGMEARYTVLPGEVALLSTPSGRLAGSGLSLGGEVAAVSPVTRPTD
jgi:multicopper oxidase